MPFPAPSPCTATHVQALTVAAAPLAQPSASERFRFLTEKVARLRVWEEHGNFLALKGLAQQIMDVQVRALRAEGRRVLSRKGLSTWTRARGKEC